MDRSCAEEWFSVPGVVFARLCSIVSEAVDVTAIFIQLACQYCDQDPQTSLSEICQNHKNGLGEDYFDVLSNLLHEAQVIEHETPVCRYFEAYTCPINLATLRPDRKCRGHASTYHDLALAVVCQLVESIELDIPVVDYVNQLREVTGAGCGIPDHIVKIKACVQCESRRGLKAWKKGAKEIAKHFAELIVEHKNANASMLGGQTTDFGVIQTAIACWRSYSNNAADVDEWIRNRRFGPEELDSNNLRMAEAIKSWNERCCQDAVAVLKAFACKRGIGVDDLTMIQGADIVDEIALALRTEGTEVVPISEQANSTDSGGVAPKDNSNAPVEKIKPAWHSWAIGMECKNRWHLFRKIDGAWRPQQMQEIPKGRCDRLMTAFAEGGGFLDKQTALRLVRSHFSSGDIDAFMGQIKPALSKLRRIIRRAIGISDSKFDPLPIDRGNHGWRAEIEIGYAITEDGESLAGTKRLRFKTRDQLTRDEAADA